MSKKNTETTNIIRSIQNRIYEIRGERVMLTEVLRIVRNQNQRS